MVRRVKRESPSAVDLLRAFGLRRLLSREVGTATFYGNVNQARICFSGRPPANATLCEPSASTVQRLNAFSRVKAIFESSDDQMKPKAWALVSWTR
jgi:hypothetical protein